MELLILAVSRYSMKGDDGSLVKGTKLECVDMSQAVEGENGRGYPPVTFDAEYDLYSHVKELPGYYQCGYTVRRATNKAGKSIPTMRINAVALVSPFFDSPAEGAAKK